MTQTRTVWFGLVDWSVRCREVFLTNHKAHQQELAQSSCYLPFFVEPLHLRRSPLDVYSPVEFNKKKSCNKNIVNGVKW